MLGRPRRAARAAIRAVVTDVDGTLTDATRRLDVRAIRAVRQLEDRGIPVLLATGNVLPIALALQRSLGISGPIIAENGGLLYDPSARPPRVERFADQRIALAAYRAVRRAGIPARRLVTDRWRETEVALEPGISVNRVRRAVRELPVLVESSGYAIHLMERGVGKLSTLHHALERRGLTVGECLVLGDGDNDVPMLRAAGFSVSFASGSPRAQRAARYVSRAEYAAGFVEGLKASGLVA
ncbi:MAG: phosphoglycolate phosphatase [Thermoplasmata archaeon]|nr:phosphoglycolate phosphatase [Thermoplasmata archaeon]